MQNRIFLTFILLCFSSVCSAIPYDEATKFYQQKQYQRAYDAFKKMAEMGNAEAMHKIGLIQVQDIPSDEDLVEGYAWLVFANESGYSDDSMANSVKFLLDSKQLHTSRQKLKYLRNTYSVEKLKAQYFPIALNSNTGGKSYIPAQLLRSPETRDKNGENVGYVDLAYTIAADGTTRDHRILYATQRKFENKALELIKQYVYQPARFEDKLMQEYYRKTRISFSNDAKALRYLERERYNALKSGSSNGNANNLYQLAEHLALSGAREESAQWLIKAAQYGSAKAKFELGRDLLYGTQCLFDYKKSLYWLTEAANAGVAEAQFLLGVEYLMGSRLPKNTSEGLILLHFAANSDLYAAKLKYAQVLAVHPSSSIRETHSPNKYVAEVDRRTYKDKISYFETRSMVDEAEQDLKRAIKWQEKAIKEAESYGLPTKSLTASLLNLQNKNMIVSD